MPTIETMLDASDLARASATTKQDLSAYFAILDRVRASNKAGADLRLGAGEDSRTEKRRLTLAAKARDLTLAWRTAPDGVLRFVVVGKGEALPGARAKRGKARVNGVPVTSTKRTTLPPTPR